MGISRLACGASRNMIGLLPTATFSREHFVQIQRLFTIDSPRLGGRLKPNTAISKRCVFRLIAVLSFAVLIAVGSLAQTTPLLIVSTVGYINGTPPTVHTSSAFSRNEN